MNEEKKTKIKLPSISKVKKALFDDWALRVKQRDGWKCLLCGGTELITAHHWHVCDHHAHMARYCVDNGATLCYTDHIRGVHQRADYYTVRRVWRAISGLVGCIDEAKIEALANVEVTTAALRAMWDAMRARPISLDDFDALVDVKGKKLFLTVDSPRQIAVVGNVVATPGFGLCEVAVVAPSGGSFRYTLKEISV